MKTTYAILLACMIYAFQPLLSQPEQGRQMKLRERVRAEKVGFITAKLELSASEAEKFWPVYNAMQKEIEAIKDDFPGRKMRGEEGVVENLSDEELIKLMKSKLDNEQSVLDIRKKYFDKLLEVIPAKKLLILHQSEEEFKRELLRRLRQGDAEPGARHRHRHGGE